MDDFKRGSGKAAEMLAALFRSHPKIKNVRGEVYAVTVFQILSKDEFGRPKDTKMIHSEESVHLNGGEEFMVGYVLQSFTEPQAAGKA